MGLFNFFGAIGEKAALSDAQKVVTVCRSYGFQERGDLKACTAMALAFIIADSSTRGDSTIDVALTALEGTQALSGSNSGMVSKLLLRMMALQKEAHVSRSQINQRIAAGIPVWIVSFRALTHVAVLPYARELWALIESGDEIHAYDVVDAATRQLGAHPMGTAMSNLKSLSTPELFRPH